MNASIAKLVLLTATLTVFAGCGARDKYEVLERTQKNVPNYQGTGTHDVVDYVLLHDGHKIYAECDWVNIGNLDPNATCGFRAMRPYSCVVPSDNIEKATGPLSEKVRHRDAV
jgi:hypothetical protein